MVNYPFWKPDVSLQANYPGFPDSSMLIIFS